MKYVAIRAVTWCVPDLERSAQAFERWLGQDAVASGRVTEQQARTWAAPAIAGARFAVLRPPSGARTFLRLIEAPETPGYAPLRNYGWNAAELHVQDVMKLAKALEKSPFRIIGPPRDLLGNGAVSAMQVLGPGGELLYLTQISHAGMQRTYGRASVPVDRVFIVALGASEPKRSLEHYAPAALRTTQRRQFPITVLARAHDMNPETARFDIVSVVMRERFRIEIDAYPSSAAQRPSNRGWLPPGMSMVTVAVDGLPGGNEEVKVRRWSPIAAGFAILRGPDGEIVEYTNTPH